jgi:hypothetical protein
MMQPLSISEIGFVIEICSWFMILFLAVQLIRVLVGFKQPPDDSLEGHYQVQRSRVINHPEYSKPVLLTEYGWAKRGHETYWYEKKITQIGEANE